MPFHPKNTSATFQWAMNCIFHVLAHLILTYLNDLTVWSKNYANNLEDLCVVLQICPHYNLRLNPLECVFCVNAGRLLGFIISQQGIRVDPLKV